MSIARKYKIRYLKKAQGDLLEIFDYIKLDSPEEAGRFIDKIDKTILRLERFPLSGTVPKDENLRKRGYRIIIIDNYLAFYVLRKTAVEIHRVIHGRRRYEFLL